MQVEIIDTYICASVNGFALFITNGLIKALS